MRNGDEMIINVDNDEMVELYCYMYLICFICNLCALCKLDLDLLCYL